jgi:hypothetical protein
MPSTSNDYDDSPDAAPAPPDDSKAQDESPTALLPKAIFGGEVKPGDTITLQVQQVDENDVICSKAESPENDENRPGAEDDSGDMEPPAGGNSMQSMLTD